VIECFSALASNAGGLNRFHHSRQPTPLDQQTVIRMNRDTLYSVAVVDLDGEPVLTVPDGGDRYLSVMVVNQDHYINQVIHEPGTYALRQTDFDTRYVGIGARILVDPVDAADLATVNVLAAGFQILTSLPLSIRRCSASSACPAGRHGRYANSQNAFETVASLRSSSVPFPMTTRSSA
jgi:hypothetical protein